MKRTAVLALALAASAVFAKAELLAPKGAKATLTAEYTFESSGKTPPQKGSKDAREWRTKRSARVTADLVADKPQEYAQLKDMTGAQKADLKTKQDKAKSVAKKMEPTMKDMEAIANKCGDDEACITREVQKYGFAMGEETADQKSARRDIADIGKTGPANYQMWQAVGQSGSYALDEWEAVTDADPGCMEKPGGVCHSDVTKKGSGSLPLPAGVKADASGARLEVDAAGKTMTVVLPTPIGPLPYTQVAKTDRPGQKSGTTEGMSRFPGESLKPIQVSIKGPSIAQSGTETLKTGEGTVTVRWQLAPAK